MRSPPHGTVASTTDDPGARRWPRGAPDVRVNERPKPEAPVSSPEPTDTVAATSISELQIVTASLSSARAEIDDAGREASARRDEAEAYFENQRARAGAAAADFEGTLQGHRDNAATEFTLAQSSHEDRLREQQERTDQLDRESEAEHTARSVESVSILDDTPTAAPTEAEVKPEPVAPAEAPAAEAEVEAAPEVTTQQGQAENTKAPQAKAATKTR